MSFEACTVTSVRTGTEARRLRPRLRRGLLDAGSGGTIDLGFVRSALPPQRGMACAGSNGLELSEAAAPGVAARRRSRRSLEALRVAADKKKWRDLHATLVFEDESGFSLVSPLKCTWAPRGQTPTLRTSISHHERLNIIGALLVTPSGRRIRLHAHSYRNNLTGDEIIAFVQDVLHSTPGPIVWVWDNHPIHRRAGVRRFLAGHERLQVYCFPTCAPELNPAEGIWTQTSEYTANTAPRNANELAHRVHTGLARTRNSQQRLWACIFMSDLPWQP